MQHYPNNLRELRKAKGLLQIEVAQLLGHLNSDRMSDWEKGYAMPSVANDHRRCVLVVVVENPMPM